MVNKLCIIAICNDRKMTKDEFDNCFESNRHGAGFSWINDDNTVEFHKGFMEQKEAWEFYHKKVNSLPHVAHFRIGSSGANNKELTHPFLITKRVELKLAHKGVESVLFHNGVLTGWKDWIVQIALKDPFILSENSDFVSDTRVLAMLIANTNNNIIDYVIRTDKIVTVSPTGILYWGDWIEEKGILFSNRGYEKFVYASSRVSSYYKDGEYSSSWWDKQFNKNKDKKEDKKELLDPFYYDDECSSRYGHL